ncbi:MAG: nucleotide exchange factor GrpE [Bacteroidales bacterium]|nr:nucleotide exchange factor GrpE [Bacteroidales bacterium]
MSRHNKRGEGRDARHDAEIKDQQEEINKTSQPEAEPEEQKAESADQTEEKKAEAQQPEQSPSQAEALLEEAKKQVQEEKNRYVYLMAEFDNFRRRVSQEKIDLIDTAAKGVINDLLPVVDNFERALKSMEESEASDSAKMGTELIYKQLLDVLKKKGVTEIDAMGKELDTDEHEAVAQIPAPEEDKKGKVVDVVQKGYKLNGKVIRFAKVVMGI